MSKKIEEKNSPEVLEKSGKTKNKKNVLEGGGQQMSCP